MASALEMTRKDMEELYQLLCVYRRTYTEKEETAERIAADLETRYQSVYGRKIIYAGNPRNAGRKRKYTEETDVRIAELRRKGLSLRRIAEEEGCSLGKVQKALKKQGVS